MTNEHFNHIIRKSLPLAKREEKWREISQLIKKEKKKHHFAYYTVFVLFGCVLLLLLQTLQAPTSSSFHREHLPVQELGIISEAIFLKNERPKKQLNVASPLYIDRLIVNNQARLKNLQQLFTNTQVAPIKQKLSAYLYSHDLLLQFENGEKRYLKIVVDSSHAYEVIDMNRMQRYVSKDKEFPSKVVSISYASTENHPFTVKIILCIAVVSITLLFTHRRRKKTPPFKVHGKAWIVTSLCLTVFILPFVVFNEFIFGAKHLGGILFSFVLLQVVPAFIYEKCYHMKADWFGILLFILSVFIALGIWYL